MTSKFSKAFRLYSENGLFLSLSLILERLGTRVRSFLVGRSLKIRRLHLGPSCEIRGARYIEIGDGFSCRGGLWLEAVSHYRDERHDPKITIGTNVSCSQHVHISCIGEITIGNNVLIGSGVYVGDHNHGQYRGSGSSSPDIPPAARALSASGPLIIEDNVFIGDKVTVVGGLRIGYGTVIAANSVVTRSLPPMAIAAGSPARVVKMYDRETRTWNSVTSTTP